MKRVPSRYLGEATFDAATEIFRPLLCFVSSSFNFGTLGSMVTSTPSLWYYLLAGRAEPLRFASSWILRHGCGYVWVRRASGTSTSVTWHQFPSRLLNRDTSRYGAYPTFLSSTTIIWILFAFLPWRAAKTTKWSRFHITRTAVTIHATLTAQLTQRRLYGQCAV